MDADYPEAALAREAAPPYDGEGAFALWHVSEDSSLRRFEPRLTPTNPSSPPYVWAIDTRHQPTFWFPRECPRGCVWRNSTTSDVDVERFFDSGVTRVHVIETNWFERVASCRLYAYRLPTANFRPHEVGGYWVADEPVASLERVELSGLVERHERAGIVLRDVSSLWPFWDQVVESTVGFSGSRLHNAAPRDAADHGPFPNTN